MYYFNNPLQATETHFDVSRFPLNAPNGSDLTVVPRILIHILTILPADRSRLFIF